MKCRCGSATFDTVLKGELELYTSRDYPILCSVPDLSIVKCRCRSCGAIIDLEDSFEITHMLEEILDWKFGMAKLVLNVAK